MANFEVHGGLNGTRKMQRMTMLKKRGLQRKHRCQQKTSRQMGGLMNRQIRPMNCHPKCRHYWPQGLHSQCHLYQLQRVLPLRWLAPL
jgi:hypothetical protein